MPQPVTPKKLKFEHFCEDPPEKARVNINILGISELKWTGTGEFNSDDHYIVGKNSLEEME